MRIVDRETFLAMPGGVIYSKYEPCNFREFAIKYDTCGGDFVCQSIMDPWFDGSRDSSSHFDTLERLQETGESSPPLDFDFAGRDGMFDREQLFAVWERHDVEALIKLLQEQVLK
jgi:hypothetical protein